MKQSPAIDMLNLTAPKMCCRVALGSSGELACVDGIFDHHCRTQLGSTLVEEKGLIYERAF
jgi:hypothetical protein